MDGANGRITHRELVDLGYIFLTKEQEDIVSAARANILRALQERRKRLLTQMTASTETEPHGQSDTDGMDV